MSVQEGESQPLLSPSARDGGYGNDDDEFITKKKEDNQPLASETEDSSTPPAEASKAEGAEEDKKKNCDADDDEDDEAVGKEMTAEERAALRLFWLWVVNLSLAASAITWIVLLATGQIALTFNESPGASYSNITLASKNATPYHAAPPRFNIRTNMTDLFIVDAFRILLGVVFFMILRAPFRPNLHVTIWHINFVPWILITAKAWCFKDWDTLRAIALIMSVVSASLVQLGHHRIDIADEPPKVILSYSGLVAVLGPYILPTGTLNRIVTLSLWLVVMGSKASQLVSPLVLGNVVELVQNRDLESASTHLILYGVLQLLPALLEGVQDAVSSWVWQQSYTEVAEKSFGKVLYLDVDWHLRKKLGSTMRAIDRGMNSAERLMSWVAAYAVPSLASGVIAFVVFSVHFAIPVMAAICWLAFVVYIWGTVLCTKVQRTLREESNSGDNIAHEDATDALQSIEVVKSFCTEERELARYVSGIKLMQKKNALAQALVSGLNTFQSLVINVCTVGALYVAAKTAVDDSFTLDGDSSRVSMSTFVAVSAYLSNIFSPLSFLGSLYSMAIASLVNIQNLATLLEEKATVVDKEGARPLDELLQPAVVGGGADSPKKSGFNHSRRDLCIEFSGVSFKYPSSNSDHDTISNLSFFVPAGTTTAIVGSTGSAKSTTVKLLLRFWDVREGSVRIGTGPGNMIDVRDLTQKSLRSHIGLIPQDTVLQNTSLRENLRYGKPDATDEEILEAAKSAQLLEFINSLGNKNEPEKSGLNTVVGERGLKISGGERQRCAIARSILKSPAILVSDEATSSLDSKTERAVQDSLNVAGQGRTQLVVAHRLSTICRAEQILVMDKGRLVERGTHDELMQIEAGRYAAMWKAQQREEEHEKALEKKRAAEAAKKSAQVAHS